MKLPDQAIPVVHAAPNGTHVFLVRSIETGERAVVITRPYRLAAWERWSWRVFAPVHNKGARRASA